MHDSRGGAAFTARSPMIKVLFPLLAAFLFLSLPAFSGGSREKVRELQGVEVREYEGKDLSSINDFRENSIKGPQQVDRASYRLRVDGLVERPLELSYGQVLEQDRYKKAVTLNCVEGWSVDILWEGVLVRDLLAQAGVRPEAKEIIFHAQDGYTTSFPVSYVEDRDILMAFRMNGVELPAERGFPFQLVAEDKWGYKWIKWITRIELSSDEGYRGYWESRGYNNQGDLSGSMFAR
jgi:DMSO/TMAO reductase YedYZ molybdopterin-dependent catalytic subunit